MKRFVTIVILLTLLYETFTLKEVNGMPLNANRTSEDFTFKHSGQVDEYGAAVGDYTAVQESFDSRAIENLNDINNIKDTLRVEYASVAESKLSKTGNFTGTWNGATMTASEPGLSSAFNAHIEEGNTNAHEISNINGLQSALDNITNKFTSYGPKTERPSTDLYPGMNYFATDILRNIQYNGSKWQLYDGSLVDVAHITDGNIYADSARYTSQTLSANAENTYQNNIDMTKDLILYTKLKLNDNDDYVNIFFGIGATVQFQLSFGYNWNTSAKDGSSIFIHDNINTNNTSLGSMDLYTSAHEAIIWYDHKTGYLNLYIDNALIGSWKPSSGANIDGVTRVFAKAGSTATLITLDYWYMAKPLVTAIGDSVTGGAILHAPNPDYYPGVDNYGSNYPKLISDYLKSKSIKNYFVVNKGVNGETSDQIKARFIADIVNTGCKYVFIHGGINDHGTHADVDITTQNKIDMANTALANSIEPIILGVIPTKTDSPLLSHQFSIDLHAAEQLAYVNYTYVDLWNSIQGSTADVADNTKMADSVHPNLTGYTAIATEIEKFLII